MVSSIPPLMACALVMNLVIMILATRSDHAYKLLPGCFVTIMWHGSWAFLFQIHDEAIGYKVAKFAHVFILYLPVTCLIALNDYLGPTRKTVLFGAHIIYLVLVALLLSSHLVISRVREFSFGLYPIAGPVHPVFLLFVAGSVGYSLARAWQIRGLSGDVVVKRHISLVGASMVMFSLASCDFLLNYQLVTFYPLGCLFSCLFVCLMFFAIFRLSAFRSEEKISLLESRILSREKMATIGNLTAGIAHQLGNTINSLKMSVLAMNVIGPKDNEDFTEIYHAMQRSIEASEKILKGINFGVKSNTLKGPKNVCDMIETAVILTKGKLLEKTRVDVAVGANVFVEAVETSFLNVMSNLLSNAADAGASEVHISISGDALVVRDNGSGIPVAIRDKIFDMMFTTKSEDQGSGIGLAVVRDELSRMGWSIQLIDSAKGATFAISGVTFFNQNRVPQTPAESLAA